MYIVRSSISAPFSFFADRTPFRAPYFHTAARGSNRMFAFVRSGSVLLGTWPPASCPAIVCSSCTAFPRPCVPPGGFLADCVRVAKFLLRLGVVGLGFLLPRGR